MWLTLLWLLQVTWLVGQERVVLIPANPGLTDEYCNKIHDENLFVSFFELFLQIVAKGREDAFGTISACSVVGKVRHNEALPKTAAAASEQGIAALLSFGAQLQGLSFTLLHPMPTSSRVHQFLKKKIRKKNTLLSN